MCLDGTNHCEKEGFGQHGGKEEEDEMSQEGSVDATGRT